MNLIFIAGLPRSGTTLLQNLITNHSQIYGGPEFDLIPDIIQLRRRIHNSIENDRISHFVSKSQADNYIKEIIINLLSNPIKNDNHYLFLSEKTPWNIFIFPELLELFPDAKFIQIMRNPIDIYGSMRKVDKRAKSSKLDSPKYTRNVFVAANYILNVIRVMNDNQNSKQVLTVTYENLVFNLEETAKQIFRFINVEFEDRVLRFFEKKNLNFEQMTSNDVWYSEKQYNQNPNNKNIVENRKLLTKKEWIFLNQILYRRKYLESLGYTFDKKLLAKPLVRFFYKNYFKKIDIKLVGSNE